MMAANMRQGGRTDIEPSANLPKVAQSKAAVRVSKSQQSGANVVKVENSAGPEVNSLAERPDWDGFSDPYWHLGQLVLWAATGRSELVDKASDDCGRLGEDYGLAAAAVLLEDIPAADCRTVLNDIRDRLLNGDIRAKQGAREVSSAEWIGTEILYDRPPGHKSEHLMVRRCYSGERVLRNLRFARCDALKLWTAAVFEVQSSIAAEMKCREWLVAQMRQYKKPPQAKPHYAKLAKEKFHVGSNSFARAWRDAVKETEAFAWSARGRKPRKPGVN